MTNVHTFSPFLSLLPVSDTVQRVVVLTGVPCPCYWARDTKKYTDKFQTSWKEDLRFLIESFKRKGHAFSRICWKQTLWNSDVSGEGHAGPPLWSHNPPCFWGFKATATEVWGCIHEIWCSLLKAMIDPLTKEERKLFLVIMGWKWTMKEGRQYQYFMKWKSKP